MYGTHMRVLYHFCCCQSHSSVMQSTVLVPRSPLPPTPPTRCSSTSPSSSWTPTLQDLRRRRGWGEPRPANPGKRSKAATWCRGKVIILSSFPAFAGRGWTFRRPAVGGGAGARILKRAWGNLFIGSAFKTYPIRMQLHSILRIICKSQLHAILQNGMLFGLACNP